MSGRPARPAGRPDFDTAAADFDRHRALPADAVLAVRRTIIANLPPQPRVLDLGAGSGRIGWPFVAAGDDYVGLDVSLSMLQAFRTRAGAGAMLVRADGQALPFPDASFDGVLLVQVFGGLAGWRPLLNDARRVLRHGGRLMLGRIVSEDDGVDAQMKRALADILGEPSRQQKNSRDEAERALEDIADATSRVEPARWATTRTPRGFLDRHATGARFSRLPRDDRTEALRALAGWAVTRFGGLDVPFAETQRFELRFYRFAER